MLTPGEAQDLAARLAEYHAGEMYSLDQVYAYWTGRQPLPVVPANVPREVQQMARMSRINVISLVISTMAQTLFVDGFRDDPTMSAENAEAWSIWQANRMDAHQTGVHRAALAYGTAYVIVLPGDPVPVIRGVSPRSLVAMYDEDGRDWPHYGLEEVRSPWADAEFRLYEPEGVHTLVGGDPEFRWRSVEEHDLGICPIVRFRNMDTLNEPPLPVQIPGAYTAGVTSGEVELLMPLQDQIDLTTFALLVAQHFQSFRQRYIVGWTADEEIVKAKAGASRLWTFEDNEIKIGEFGQVDLGGYLSSREDTITQLGVISQTPGHELLGKMVNLSAEALVAADAARTRKTSERQQLFGESWEQAFFLASRAAGLEMSENAQVRWRDTEPRSLSQTIDALGKLAQMLGVPPDELWERIPGVTQQDVERWRQSAERGNPLGMLGEMLNRQMQPAASPAPTNGVPVPA